MVSYRHLKEVIQASYPDLTKNHKRIADYFLANMEKVPFLSVQELSLEVKASVASVVRFAQQIGYSGYSELREDVSSILQNKISNGDIFNPSEALNPKTDLLSSIAGIEVKNINSTLQSLDRASLAQVVKSILKADKVYTAGLGVSYYMSEVLAYQLNQVAVNADNLRHDSMLLIEQIPFIKKNDFIVFFSFPPYSKETIEAAELACTLGIKSAAITNKTTAPITRFTDHQLLVSSENLLYTNALTGIAVLINTIVTECGRKNKEKARVMISLLKGVENSYTE